MQTCSEKPLGSTGRRRALGLAGVMVFAGVLAGASLDCGGSGECNQFSDCSSGLTCTAGKCVVPPIPPDASSDASGDVDVDVESGDDSAFTDEEVLSDAADELDAAGETSFVGSLMDNDNDE